MASISRSNDKLVGTSYSFRCHAAGSEPVDYDSVMQLVDLDHKRIATD